MFSPDTITTPSCSSDRCNNSSDASHVLTLSVGSELCSSVSLPRTSCVTSVTFSGVSNRPATSVHSAQALPNLLSLPSSLSLLQFQNSPSALPTGLVDIVTHLYNMVRPRGVDMGTQTEGVGEEDNDTEMKWRLE